MRQKYELIVAGCGIAGLAAAITARERGLSVLVLSKADSALETNTNYAQGGIIASGQGDSPELLAKDILEAGCHYNYIPAVEVLASQGPKAVYDFLADKAGVPFDRGPDGNFDYTEEAAHSSRRILHYEDHSGDVIQKTLIDYSKKMGIEILTSHTAVELITNRHHSDDCQEIYRNIEVLGLYVLDNESGLVKTVFADAVILATGGIGNIFQYTTNPPEASGDGIAMAHRAGADIINAEFVQFHPTALFHKDIRRFLVSESLRGEGARLVRRDGSPFMHEYSPLGDLAPRDVVARAIYEEMARDGTKYVLLDLANYYKGELPIHKRFKRIYETCLAGGLDIEKESIPVTPAAHYLCGGIKVDIDGRSTIRRLYAAGEVSCTGVHGANRLASTSLLEGLLWGIRAADDIAMNIERLDSARLDKIPDWRIPQNPETVDASSIYQDWNLIKLTMWNHAGIVRSKKGLHRAEADLNYHAHRITRFYNQAALTRDLLELRNGITVAQLLVKAALHNEVSLGCHYRVD